ncbi:MAG: hypothetical protein HXX80_02290 [Nitrososphaerales archaeon]|nr:hypothetical protein [Nitrososphaerales archaeon]
MESTFEELARVELNRILFNVHCVCDKDFRTEDFQPICPYCNRRYFIEMVVTKQKPSPMYLNMGFK